MTLNDLIKRVKKEDYDKVIIFKDIKGGWCNVNLEIENCTLTLKPDTKLIFTSDK
jgi:hypothetical protein